MYQLSFSSEWKYLETHIGVEIADKTQNVVR